MTNHTDIADGVDPEQCVRRWVDEVVVGLNLCPFAKREVVNDRIRYVVEPTDQTSQLLETLLCECHQLVHCDQYETTIVILQKGWVDFGEYNELLSLVDALIVDAGFEGVFQVASFHPKYQFADTAADEVSNYTNRAPFPLLHILREVSVTNAINAYPDAGMISARNIQRLESMGVEAMINRLAHACRHDL